MKKIPPRPPLSPSRIGGLPPPFGPRLPSRRGFWKQFSGDRSWFAIGLPYPLPFFHVPPIDPRVADLNFEISLFSLCLESVTEFFFYLFFLPREFVICITFPQIPLSLCSVVYSPFQIFSHVAFTSFALLRVLPHVKSLSTCQLCVPLPPSVSHPFIIGVFISMFFLIM